ncbi:CMRF35-like molecule 1 [Lissotriton helveticus]
MAFPLLLLFVGVVSGQGTEVEQRSPGESVTVSCDYDDDYKDHQKIWCRETRPRFCDTVVITPRWSSETQVSATYGRTHISDNKRTQQIFVTVQKLEERDAGVYWCGVSFYSTKEVQIRKKIDLRISEGFTNSPERILTDSTDESQEEDNKESDENSRLSDLYIILITVGLCFLFLLTIIALFYIRWARKRKNERLIEPSGGHSNPGLEASMKGTSAEENPGTIPSELNSQEMKYATLTLHARRDQEEATYSNVGLGSKPLASAARYNTENVEYASINLQTLQGRGEALK